MVLRVKPTPTRFPTNSLYTPMDNTPLHCVPPVGLSLLSALVPDVPPLGFIIQAAPYPPTSLGTQVLL